jgi:histidinol dehydrogenase
MVHQWEFGNDVAIEGNRSMKIMQYPSPAAEKRLVQIEKRGLGFQRKDLVTVQRILEDVRKNGDDALVKYSRQFDAPDFKPHHIRVTKDEMAAAMGAVDAGFKRSLNRAARQIAAFHTRQRINSWFDTPRPGTLLGQMVHPVDAAGIYVPGGQGGATPLVSSVLMGAIPAKIAGVSQIVMVTPPTKEGLVSPYLLAAARKAGVDAVYKVGSAWSVAALTYGTATIPKVDVVVGPGNIYVTLAKKLVAGTVQIDMIAGPSEILVLADTTADPEYVAADMLSQAEHDPMASAILVTDSQGLAESVNEALMRRLEQLERRQIAEQSIRSYGALMVVANITAAIELANRIAPEHLELIIGDPFARVGELRHAGAIFVGPFTPEPVGDYMAGPNHVLPTAGTARFSSALSVDHFVKKTSLIHYARNAFQKEAQDIIRLANIEGLGAHAQAVQVRLSQSKK